MLLSLLLLASAFPSVNAASAAAINDDPPVRIWFNSSGNYAPGDRAKVYARSDRDGYLIVLRADDEGYCFRSSRETRSRSPAARSTS